MIYAQNYRKVFRFWKKSSFCSTESYYVSFNEAGWWSCVRRRLIILVPIFIPLSSERAFSAQASSTYSQKPKPRELVSPVSFTKWKDFRRPYRCSRFLT